MSLFYRLLGNTAEIDVEELRSELEDLLTDGEQLKRAFVLYRDFFVFSSIPNGNQKSPKIAK